MAGIIFTTTNNITEITRFYKEIIGCKHWLTQPDVEILRHDNLLIGFHQTDIVDLGGLFTFFYSDTRKVDEMYEIIQEKGLTKTIPMENKKYQIYNFFAEDPEGRKLEFQTFLRKIPDFK